jgi:tetratricopeptide (TPR) repeat protein
MDAARPPVSESELALARLMVEQGLLTPERVAECLEEIRRLAEQGASPVPKLGELIVRKGYLTPAHYEQTLRMETPRSRVLETPAAALPVEVARADAGQRFGKYVRVHKLGAGGMGEVWKAWDLELARWVALKFLKGGNDDEIQRFVREAQLAGKLSHPHIAAIYDVGQDRDRHFIAMQFVDGRTLRGLPRPDPQGLARLLRDAARAVHYAHEQGIVHRDLKPDNLMATARAGAEPHLYVMDFGLARATEGASNLSVSGFVVGTPAYMSPEQARGERVDGRADVYALGVTLYELRSGRLPFESDNVLDLLRKAAEEEARPLEGELGTIAAKAMEKEPARRYASAAELADDLERWLTGEPIQARRASVVYQVRKRLVKRKAAVAAVAALALAAGLAAFLMPLLVRARRFNAAYERATAEVNEFTLAVATGSPRRNEVGREAVRALEAALAVDDRRPAPWIWLGRCRKILGGDAKACWEAALAADPANAEALLERGRQALEEYQSERGEPEISYAYFGTARHVREVGGETPAQARKRESGLRDLDAARQAGVPGHLASYLEGLSAFGRGDFAAAESALEKYLDRVGWDAPAYLLRARARRHRQKYREAEGDCDRALRLQERNAEAHLLRGVLFRDQDRLPDAVAALDAALAADPREAMALYLRGVILNDLLRKEEAFRDLSRAIEIEPGLARAHSARGWTLLGTNRLAQAETDLTRALELDPRDAKTWTRRGFYYHYYLKRFDEALRDYTKAVELNPDAATYCNRGRVLNLLGRPGDAESDLLKALEIDSKFWPAWEDLGLLRYRQGRLEEAERDLDRAIREGGQAPEVFRARGYFRASAGRWADAVADLRKACDQFQAKGLDKSEQDYPRLWIALLRFRLGERAAAEEELRAHAKGRGKEDWYARMAAFIAGDVPEADFLRSADAPDEKARREQTCEAYYYAGVLRLVAGDAATAKRYLERALETGLKDFIEYQGAEAELRRLGPPK